MMVATKADTMEARLKVSIGSVRLEELQAKDCSFCNETTMKNHRTSEVVHWPPSGRCHCVSVNHLKVLGSPYRDYCSDRVTGTSRNHSIRKDFCTGPFSAESQYFVASEYPVANQYSAALQNFAASQNSAASPNSAASQDSASRLDSATNQNSTSSQINTTSQEIVPPRSLCWQSLLSSRRRTVDLPMLALLLLHLLSSGHSLSTERCVRQLGMSDNTIPDDHITASSHYDAAVNAFNARAHIEVGGGAWCPRGMIYDKGVDYLEVNLGEEHVVTKVEVQGRFGNGLGREFAEQYKLQYWRSALENWVTYRDGRGEELLEGNANTYLAKANPLRPPVIASRIRFVPYSNHPRTVCMRVELYGCKYTDGVLSYAMIDGEMRGNHYGLRDLTYDGNRSEASLWGGLGQLSDGEVGHTNFKLDDVGNEGGYEWVGWKNDSRLKQDTVEVVFEFDQLRNFTAIHLHCNNLITKGVQVFSRADVYISSDVDEPFQKVEEFLPEADRVFENARTISIKLNRVTARLIKLELYFAQKWMMVSEVTFDSVPCGCEVPPPTIPSDPLFELVPSDQPQTNNKAAIIEEDNFHPGPTEGKTEQAVITGQNPALLIGGLVTLGVVFGTIPVFVVIMYYRNKMLKKGAKAQQYNGDGRNRRITLKVNDGPITLNNGLVVGEYAHSEGRLYGDLDALDEAAAMYQEPYKDPTTGQAFYSLGRGTIAYEEPLDMGPDTEDSLDYAVPDVTLTSSTNRGKNMCKYSSAALFPPFMGAFLDIPPPPIPPPPEEPSHSPPPSDVQGVVGSTFFALPESDIHEEDPAIPKLFHSQVSVHQVIGESAFGFAQLCDLEPHKSGSRLKLDNSSSNCKRHVLKKLKPEWVDFARDKLFKEIHILSQLRDENIAGLAGVITEEESPVMVIQYTDYGDLHQFLRRHITSDIDSLPSNTNTENKKRLSRGALLHIAAQVASGMKYLESRNVVHRDLAARNCLIGRGLVIKISDIALCRSQYADDYCDIEGRSLLPVRWMAPETLIHSLYTIKSDVWSFGVTLWEIFTMARQKPLENLSDNAAVEEICQTCHVDGQPTLLPQPTVYGREIYQMMTSCWRAVDRQRPPFWEIHMFLRRKNMGYAVDYVE